MARFGKKFPLWLYFTDGGNYGRFLAKFSAYFGIFFAFGLIFLAVNEQII